MTFPLYALTTHSAPVLIGDYPTRQARNRAEREERERHDTLGDGTVLDIVTELPSTTDTPPYRITLTDRDGTQTVRYALTKATALAIQNEAMRETVPDPRFRRSQESTERRTPRWVACEAMWVQEDGTVLLIGRWTQTVAERPVERTSETENFGGLALVLAHLDPTLRQEMLF